MCLPGAVLIFCILLLGNVEKEKILPLSAIINDKTEFPRHAKELFDFQRAGMP